MKLLLPFLACAAVWMGCASNKGGQSAQVDVMTHPESVTVTQQDVYPGAQGMVRKIRTYSVSGVADFRSPVTVHRLRVDSLQFPVKQLKINNTIQPSVDVDPAAGMVFSFTATRMFTGDNKPNPVGFGQGARLLNAQTLEHSGVLLDGTAELVLLAGTDTLVIDLGVIDLAAIIMFVFAPCMRRIISFGLVW